MNQTELCSYLSNKIREMLFNENTEYLIVNACNILEMSVRLRVARIDKYYEEYSDMLQKPINIPENEEDLMLLYCVFAEAIEDIHEMLHRIIMDTNFQVLYKIHYVPKDLAMSFIQKNNTLINNTFIKDVDEICENIITLGKLSIYEEKEEEKEEEYTGVLNEKSPFIELSAD
jgi:hypothetical protein